MGDTSNDGRFSHIANDPRFKTIPHSQRQVKIDKRFQAMFNDDRFKMKYTVDKRGRPVSRTSKEDLERFYALSSSDSENEDEDEDDAGPSKPSQSIKDKKDLQPKTGLKLNSSDDTSSGDSAEEESESDEEAQSDIDSNNEELTDKIKSKLHDMSVDYARGEGAILSDSSSDEDSTDEEEDKIVEHGWGELDKDADRTEEVTKRLAVCNMNWDRIRATDLMVLLNSFIPPGGLIRSVTIYPSEYGLERMKKEEDEGPPELVETSSKTKTKIINGNKNEMESNDEDEDDVYSGSDNGEPADENEEGSTYHREKLRQYQLNRLKYFYAVVECDSPNTANHIYSECDGMEYESSATRLDLRFVPDDTSFDQEPKETCSKMPDAVKYRPRSFTTTALQQANVELTWDETDLTRTEIANRLLSGDNVDDDDLRTYLASSSEEEENNAVKEKKKVSLKGKNDIKNKMGKGKSKDKQSRDDKVSDEDDDPIAKYRALLTGIEEEENEKKNKGVHMEISWGLGLKEKTDEVMKKKLLKSKELTPFQEMMEKRKQKRQEKKKLKQDKKMQKIGDCNNEELISDDDIPSDIDMNDRYFAEERENVKKTSKKKKTKKHEEDSQNEEEQNKKAELELLLLDKDDRKHFNFKKIQEEESINQSKRKKKAKRKMEKKGLQEDTHDDFKVNVDDNRFSALYSSHHYNIDPTDSHFRKSHGMEALISAKQKRLANSTPQTMDCIQNPPPPKKSKKDAELSLLVKSIKNKAQKLNKR